MEQARLEWDNLGPHWDDLNVAGVMDRLVIRYPEGLWGWKGDTLGSHWDDFSLEGHLQGRCFWTHL